MKTILLAGFAIAAVAGFAPVLASAQAPTATTPTHRAPHGKAATRAEMTQKVQQHFARLDADRDGFVTKAESEAAMQAKHARVNQRVEKRGTAIFDGLDADKNGVVTRAEAEPFFASGRVDIADARPGEAKPRRNWDALIARHDANKDGAISRAEFEAGHAQRAQKIAQRRPAAGMRRAAPGGHMLETADSNNDGRVSLAEATAAATARFDAADTNRDGILSPAEMRQAHQAKGSKTGRR